MKAPFFSLPDQNGAIHSLTDYSGKWIVLYFYPKDDTPGCTVEACSFRDSFSALKKLGTVVLGVSTDPVKKHAKFVQKYELPFTLLADEEKKVVELYSVWGKKKFMGREYMGMMRHTFVVDGEGRIERAYLKVKAETMADDILSDLALS